MNSSDALTCIGRITKRWGFQDEVLISLREGAALPKKKSEPVYVMIDGRPVPFFVKNMQPQGKKGAIVAFYDMSDFLLQSILQCEVFVSEKQPETTPATNPQDALAGYSVHDQAQGFIGTVSHLMDREIQPVLVILFENQEILIPFTPEIIRKTDHKKRIMLINAPDGLIDLYLNP